MFFVVLCLLANPIPDTKVERPAVVILSIPAGARAVGMGSSSIGKCDDPIGIKYNLDRSYDFAHPDQDIWHGSGWEFEFFNYFAYRFGSFEWMGKSNGIGVNLGIYSIDVTEFFNELDGYHVQITINPGLTNYYTDNYTKKKIFTFGSLFITPGGAQFYKGEGLKEALFFIPGLVLGNYYFSNSDKTIRFFSLTGIGLLYLGSAIESFINQ